tara:strand:- start:375 stop:638 length:264 start_codon:yes stop_codon:yes gene_type:complete
MKKELKYFLYVFTILGFIFFVTTYYFSDINKKNSYRLIELFDQKIITYEDNLDTLESNTENTIEYVENNLNKNKKKFKFWELLDDDS